ncbi:NAD(+) synthase [Moorella sulfitireducens (nom. illeg.)]|uniref:NAD(+) synthase n=1 Tax=Neomoorella sulfitireducens TaxID=2972948 RepID=UPI0021AC6995|nr:NAD(+) synthase [Moorella sulfitireducens]
MPELRNGLALNPAEAAQKICTFISDKVTGAKARGVVVGISGGLDSAVVAFLCVRALGPERVTGLFLPERDTAPESAGDARSVAEKTGIALDTIDLTPALTALGCYSGKVASTLKNKIVGPIAFGFIKTTARKSPFELTLAPESTVVKETVAFFRLKHRLRMCTLYHRAEKEGMLVAGCLNRTEQLTSFFVRYGDSAADLAPILPLYKTQVRALAAYLEVPQPIIDRPPSPDLIPSITDEMALGVTYEVLDLILVGLESGMDHAGIASATGVAPDLVAKIKSIVSRAQTLKHDPPYPLL